jgi:hypothetical protein
MFFSIVLKVPPGMVLKNNAEGWSMFAGANRKYAA